jgi:hypothetical protein
MRLPLFLTSRLKLSSYHGDDWREYFFPYGRTELYRNLYLVRSQPSTVVTSAREVLVLEGEVIYNGRRARAGDWFESEPSTGIEILKESVYLEKE